MTCGLRPVTCDLRFVPADLPRPQHRFWVIKPHKLCSYIPQSLILRSMFNLNFNKSKLAY